MTIGRYLDELFADEETWTLNGPTPPGSARIIQFDPPIVVEHGEHGEHRATLSHIIIKVEK